MWSHANDLGNTEHHTVVQSRTVLGPGVVDASVVSRDMGDSPVPCREHASRRPLSNQQATEEKVRDFIVKTRLELTAAGWDAGPVTIAWHLEQAGLYVPSTSTIRRVLHAAGLVTPEPRKRPRSSYLRFEAAQPNECWQSDFTHWPLAGGADVEIINWLDDHSRYLLACSACAPVTGKVVVDTFLQAGSTHGLPASTLTDIQDGCVGGVPDVVRPAV
jgi:transposase InsO family protein